MKKALKQYVTSLDDLFTNETGFLKTILKSQLPSLFCHELKGFFFKVYFFLIIKNKVYHILKLPWKILLTLFLHSIYFAVDIVLISGVAFPHCSRIYQLLHTCNNKVFSIITSIKTHFSKMRFLWISICLWVWFSYLWTNRFPL